MSKIECIEATRAFLIITFYMLILLFFIMWFLYFYFFVLNYMFFCPRTCQVRTCVPCQQVA